MMHTIYEGLFQESAGIAHYSPSFAIGLGQEVYVSAATRDATNSPSLTLQLEIGNERRFEDYAPHSIVLNGNAEAGIAFRQRDDAFARVRMVNAQASSSVYLRVHVYTKTVT